MRLTKSLSAGLVFLSVAATAADLRQGAAAPPAAPSADVAMEWLRYGNERHAAGKHVHWHQSADRRKEVARGQRPHTIILSCADSQVPPEILFDQGLGDMFVVRVAGNVVGEKELGSIEYAAEHLGAGLVVVLGHQRCGAVQAAVQGGGAPGHIGSILASLSPAVARAKALPGDTVDYAIHANVEMTVDELKNSEPMLGHRVRSGKLKVTGAVYSLDSGVVEWIGDGKPGARQISSLPHQ